MWCKFRTEFHNDCWTYYWMSNTERAHTKHVQELSCVTDVTSRHWETIVLEGIRNNDKVVEE